MDEVAGILVAVVALILGLLALGWAYGDFSRPAAAPPKPDQPHPSS